MMSNGWIDSWRHSFPRINRQVEIGQYLAVNSPIPRRAHVGLKEQRSHVPVLSQLGDKPFCLLQLVAALCILRLLLSLRIAIASFSFSFFFFILFSRGFFLYLLYLFWRLSFLFRLLSVHLESLRSPQSPVHVHVPIATHPPDHTIWRHHQFDNGELLLLFLLLFRPLMNLRRTMI